MLMIYLVDHNSADASNNSTLYPLACDRTTKGKKSLTPCFVLQAVQGCSNKRLLKYWDNVSTVVLEILGKLLIIFTKITFVS